MTLIAHIRREACLNNIGNTAPMACSRCEQTCPAHAIKYDETYLPQLDMEACTGCTACVRICPVDAISHEKVDPVELLRNARHLRAQGKTTIQAACSTVSSANADLNIPCHAMWDPMLLACLAAEGVTTLQLHGINQCDTCPTRHGAKVMQQTEKDYATLNTALGVRMNISRQREAPAPVNIATRESTTSQAEPSRRAFFRNLIPSITHSAAMAAAQITQVTSQAMQGETTPPEHADHERLPVRLRLFLSALPRLQTNFTPIPPIPTLPMAALQADAKCTACNRCVDQCPTQALSIREFGANKVLEFQPDACIGCLQCIVSCPENSLESLPGISLPAVLARRARPLVMVRNDITEKRRPGPTA